MSTYLPAILGENLMDVFDDFDRDFFRGFGNIDRALYGKHAQRMMKTDVKETDEGYEVDVELPGYWKMIEAMRQESLIYTWEYFVSESGESMLQVPDSDADALRMFDIASFVLRDAFSARYITDWLL